MRPLFHPRLIHGPFGDPGLYVAWMHRGRAILFDLPDLSPLPTGDLLKVSHAFVSHTHMDHFIGLDSLVRLTLGRKRTLRLFGPSPILEQTASRLRSYTWNLVGGYAERLLVVVTQIRGSLMERAFLDCREEFRDKGLREVVPFNGILWEEPGMRVRAVVLDHKVPSLAFSLEEPVHVQVLKGKLERHGLRPGAWLRTLREKIMEGAPPETVLEVSPREMGPRPLGWLRENLVRCSRGQKIGYVVDAAPTQENLDRVVELVQRADVLFIEAPFPERETHRARHRAHLTALKAGQVAAMAEVGRVVPFHLSPKYGPDPSALLEEVGRGFEGGDHGVQAE
jgi:ribonuclease Z